MLALGRERLREREASALQLIDGRIDIIHTIGSCMRSVPSCSSRWAGIIWPTPSVVICCEGSRVGTARLIRISYVTKRPTDHRLRRWA